MLSDGLVKGENVVIVESIEDLAATLAITDQPRVPKGPELMRHRRLRDGQQLGQVTDTAFCGGKKRDEAESSWICQDAEEFGHLLRFVNAQRRNFLQRPIVRLGADWRGDSMVVLGRWA